MQLLDEVRRHCAAVARGARHVSIDLSAAREPPPAATDPAEPSDADAVLQLDAINFGSGWFPTLRKRPGMSGYRTVAAAFAEHGPWPNGDLRSLDSSAVAAVLGQDARHPLMRLYAQALRDLGRFLGDRSALDLVDESGGSGERLAAALARGMRFFDDRGFYKRAQIVPSDLAQAGVARFDDLDRLTIFADNLVPHVLRVDGVLSYDTELAARIDAGHLLPQGRAECEIRACAVHACEALAERFGLAPRLLDIRLWNRGQRAEYKAVPRHRTRTVYY
jgi:Potential Queuosine, Q, salvage protein family